jgi:hypothetical protein
VNVTTAGSFANTAPRPCWSIHQSFLAALTSFFSAASFFCSFFSITYS